MARKTAQAKNVETEKAAELDNQRRELFCRYFTQNDQLFNNATRSYAEAYDYKLDELSREGVYEQVLNEDTGEYENGELIESSEYDKACHVCAVEASKLLRKPEIQQRIVELRNELMRDDFVDSELVKVMHQDDDLTPKVAAIKEYNKLRGRIIDKTKIITETFTADDIRSLLAPLPQERQDQIYAILTDALAEAELLRSGSQGTSSNPQ